METMRKTKLVTSTSKLGRSVCAITQRVLVGVLAATAFTVVAAPASLPKLSEAELQARLGAVDVTAMIREAHNFEVTAASYSPTANRKKGPAANFATSYTFKMTSGGPMGSMSWSAGQVTVKTPKMLALVQTRQDFVETFPQGLITYPDAIGFQRTVITPSYNRSVMGAEVDASRPPETQGRPGADFLLTTVAGVSSPLLPTGGQDSDTLSLGERVQACKNKMVARHELTHARLRFLTFVKVLETMGVPSRGTFSSNDEMTAFYKAWGAFDTEAQRQWDQIDASDPLVSAKTFSNNPLCADF